MRALIFKSNSLIQRHEKIWYNDYKMMLILHDREKNLSAELKWMFISVSQYTVWRRYAGPTLKLTTPIDSAVTAECSDIHIWILKKNWDRSCCLPINDVFSWGTCWQNLFHISSVQKLVKIHYTIVACQIYPIKKEQSECLQYSRAKSPYQHFY